MSDDIEETVRRVAEATNCSTADISALAAGLASLGESARDVFERMAESMAEIRGIADEQTKPEGSRQRFRENGKRRW